LWEIVEPLLPARPPVEHGGRPRVDDRDVLATILFVDVTGCSWRDAQVVAGVDHATAHRRFQAWTRAGLWPRLHRAVLEELGRRALLDWSRACVDAQSVRAKKGAR
jgi:transposase